MIQAGIMGPTDSKSALAQVIAYVNFILYGKVLIRWHYLFIIR